MSFRNEEKLLINQDQLYDFKKWLQLNHRKVLFPKRKISSIYFENFKNEMFHNSEEGTLPRKKIRVRTYPSHIKNKFFLETKISSVEGRFKTSKEINLNYYNKIKKNGYLDDLYGNCFPKLHVSYIREYYAVFKQRITVDQQIQYSTNLKTNAIHISDPQIVVEIKSDENTDISNLLNDFPFSRIRFSKYCRGFLNLLNH